MGWILNCKNSPDLDKQKTARWGTALRVCPTVLTLYFNISLLTTKTSTCSLLWAETVHTISDGLGFLRAVQWAEASQWRRGWGCTTGFPASVLEVKETCLEVVTSGLCSRFKTCFRLKLYSAGTCSVSSGLPSWALALRWLRSAELLEAAEGAGVGMGGLAMMAGLGGRGPMGRTERLGLERRGMSGALRGFLGSAGNGWKEKWISIRFTERIRIYPVIHIKYILTFSLFYKFSLRNVKLFWGFYWSTTLVLVLLQVLSGFLYNSKDFYCDLVLYK